MKLKLDTIWNMQQSLAKLADREISDFKASYRIAKILKKFTNELKTVEETRQKIVAKYAQPVLDSEGKETGSKRVPETKLEEFGKEWSAVLSEEVEIEGIVKVELPDDIKLTPREIADLEEILEIKE